MKSSFNVSGLENYLEVLQNAEKDINLVAREALGEAAQIIQSAMLSRVPFDTGNLKNHIKIKTPSREGNYNYVEIGIIHDAAFTDKKTAIYARVIEFGSATVAARPYIRPAISSKRAAVTNLIRERLKKAGLVD